MALYNIVGLFSEVVPGEEGFDKLYKIRPLLEMLSKTYLKSYRPTKMQAIDESMIRLKGRSSIELWDT